ncbi:hypothetical protein POJ06DRAFT_281179 [Lipomyces tetrasporus]|uniref:Alpha-1,3/1,6-mannosyltransferase ALG2 n=1 Tax=Lipomyces tetrasporus TaxID=54092 RepID=A0AAD7VTF4_9ASCO|nr:uncharacterized protein POJ06DRAFT_281179 [Lipomyces tetrasporus]KAJ8101408.1 hypothetical protein POJ06DRAFT_281179 [Lipomyces tetrasporus]
MKIAFIHPDLGIGGAERLIVDAAVGLLSLGHTVTVYTSRCDRKHCFEEVRDGTLDVIVKGDTIFPRTIFGRFAILCAILRQLHLTLFLLQYENTTYDAIFVDQLSFCVPLLRIGLDRWNSSPNGDRRSTPVRRKRKARILFYCHFPDKLLATRKSLIKRLYRLPFDAIEAYSTSRADILLVNSRYTQRMFRQEFPSIDRTPTVVYPCVSESEEKNEKVLKLVTDSGKGALVSVNRFEKKKGIDLAVRAYASLREAPGFAKTALLVAGGYDKVVQENVECLSELQGLCDKLGMEHTTVWDIENNLTLLRAALSSTSVVFCPSVSSPVRNALISGSRALTYTPTNEHFGIVPLEAMLMNVPVIATSTGGPLETVDDGVTGWLRAPDVGAWSSAFHRVLFEATDAELKMMGKQGRETVLKKFSRTEMAASFERAFLSASEFSSGDDTDAGQQPAIMRTPGLRDGAWIAILGCALYYCKYGLAFTVPSVSEVLVGSCIVLVVYYAFF